MVAAGSDQTTILVRPREAGCANRCATFSPAPIQKTSSTSRNNSRFAPGERATLAQRLARLLVESRPHAQSVVILARMAWLANNVAHDIEAYLDPPKSLGELREAALNPKKGYDVHHIVEQGPARRDGFDDGTLQSGSNKVLIPRYKHWEISAWFATKNDRFGGMSPRDHLRRKTWEERYTIGLEALQLFGVLEK